MQNKKRVLIIGCGAIAAALTLFSCKTAQPVITKQITDSVHVRETVSEKRDTTNIAGDSVEMIFPFSTMGDYITLTPGAIDGKPYFKYPEPDTWHDRTLLTAPGKGGRVYLNGVLIADSSMPYWSIDSSFKIHDTVYIKKNGAATLKASVKNGALKVQCTADSLQKIIDSITKTKTVEHFKKEILTITKTVTVTKYKTPKWVWLLLLSIAVTFSWKYRSPIATGIKALIKLLPI